VGRAKVGVAVGMGVTTMTMGVSVGGMGVGVKVAVGGMNSVGVGEGMRVGVGEGMRVNVGEGNTAVVTLGTTGGGKVGIKPGEVGRRVGVAAVGKLVLSGVRVAGAGKVPAPSVASWLGGVSGGLGGVAVERLLGAEP
jgi:hypothetical protein